MSCVSTGSSKVVITVPPKITEPDRALIARCVPPQDLGKVGLSQKQVEDLWGKDRKSLVSCKRIHDALIDFVEEQDKLLKGTK